MLEGHDIETLRDNYICIRKQCILENKSKKTAFFNAD